MENPMGVTVYGRDYLQEEEIERARYVGHFEEICVTCKGRAEYRCLECSCTGVFVRLVSQQHTKILCI